MILAARMSASHGAKKAPAGAALGRSTRKPTLEIEIHGGASKKEEVASLQVQQDYLSPSFDNRILISAIGKDPTIIPNAWRLFSLLLFCFLLLFLLLIERQKRSVSETSRLLLRAFI